MRKWIFIQQFVEREETLQVMIIIYRYASRRALFSREISGKFHNVQRHFAPKKVATRGNRKLKRRCNLARLEFCSRSREELKRISAIDVSFSLAFCLLSPLFLSRVCYLEFN